MQIKGKVRGRIMVPATLGKDDGEKLLENETVKKLVGDAQVKKCHLRAGPPAEYRVLKK